MRMRSAASGGRRHAIAPMSREYRPDLRVSGEAHLVPCWIMGGPERIAPGEEGIVEGLLWFDDLVDWRGLTPGATGVVLEGPHVVGHFEVLAILRPNGNMEST